MTDASEDRDEIAARIRAWSMDHRERYVSTNGEDGYLVERWPTLILTTVGRRSGKPRSTPLIFGVDGDRYVLVGSFAGLPTHPAWYLNLLEHPRVQVQVNGERFPGRAFTAAGEDRRRLWKMMADLYPRYEDYQAKSPREIPVVVVERG